MNTDVYQRDMNLLYISPKKATILLNPIWKKSGADNPTQYEIYSIRSVNLTALKSILQDLIAQADKCDATLFISSNCLSRLASPEKELLVKQFQFERKGILYVRRPQCLASVPFDVVPVRETENGYTIVNNEYYATAFNIRNIYREVLSSFTSKAEAELLFEMYR